MSYSTQSQEAIASIDAELSAILKRSTSVKSILKSSTDSIIEPSQKEQGNSESESEIHTDSGEDYDPKETTKNKKKQPKPTKQKKSPRKRSAHDEGDVPAAKSQKIQQLTATSSAKEKAVESHPPMQRTKSLEAIIKHQPPQIIKVCLEKTTTLLQEAGKKDYKKVKYWLKIAQTMSEQISREEDFQVYLKGIQETYKDDKELLNIIEEFISNTA